MLIVGLTESSARFITGLIIVLIVMAFLGCLSQATGIHPFILIGIFLLIFVGLFLVILKASLGSRTVPSERRCIFIRANGSQCVKAKKENSDYCEHHVTLPKIGEPVPTSVQRTKRSQCGFVRDDGSKCKKLKPVEIPRCDYHLKLEEVAGK